jgi:hypothetical protein
LSLALGHARLFPGQTVAALDLLGELTAPEVLLAGVDGLIAVEDVEGGGGGSHVRHRDGLLGPALWELIEKLGAGGLHGIGLHIYHGSGESGQLQGCHSVLHVLAARGGEQYIHHVGVLGGGTQNLKVDVDLFQRVGDVLIRLQQDLGLPLGVAQGGGHRYDLGDYRRSGYRHGRPLGLGARLLHHLVDGLAHRLHVGDVLLHDRVRWQRLHPVALYPVQGSGLAAGVAQLEQLHCRGADVEADQREPLAAQKGEHSGVSDCRGCWGNVKCKTSNSMANRIALRNFFFLSRPFGRAALTRGFC